MLYSKIKFVMNCNKLFLYFSEWNKKQKDPHNWYQSAFFFFLLIHHSIY